MLAGLASVGSMTIVLTCAGMMLAGLTSAGRILRCSRVLAGCRSAEECWQDAGRPDECWQARCPLRRNF